MINGSMMLGTKAAANKAKELFPTEPSSVPTDNAAIKAKLSANPQAVSPVHGVPDHARYAMGGYPGASGGQGYGGSASNMQARIAREQRQWYNELYRPVNRRLVADVNSTALIDSTKATADKGYDAGQARGLRQRDRLGVNSTALDRSRLTHTAQVNRGLNYDTQVNNSRIDQFERNQNLRTELVNLSRGIANQASGDLSITAQNETNRNNANANARAQNKAAKKQQQGQMAGMALMAVMMM